MKSSLRLAGWAVALLVFVRIGRGPLSTPPVTDVSRFREWMEAQDGVEAAFALLRLGAIAVCGYLVVTTALVLLARTTRSARLARVSELATIPAFRRLVGGVAGIGLSASLATFTAGTVSSGRDRIAVSTDARAGSDRFVIERLPADDPLVIEHVDDDPPRGTATMRVVPTTPPAASPPPTTWTVVPGESLWSKAESVLAGAWGRAPTDREITPYWQSLIDANRTRLADPGNPDLIFSKQVFELPPPPAG
jgi:hypothetical protein